MDALAAPTPVIEHGTPAPAVGYTWPASVTEYASTSPAAACAVPTSGIEYVSTAPASTGVIAGRGTCIAFIDDALQTLHLSASTSPTAAYATPTSGIEYVSPAPAGTCAESNSGVEANDVTPADAYGEDDLQWSTHSVDVDCEHLVDRVYDAVRNGQSPHELQRDGWDMGEIHEAVGIWYELRAFARSQEKGLSLAPGFGLAAADILTIVYPMEYTYFASEVGYGKKTFEGLLDRMKKTGIIPLGGNS